VAVKVTLVILVSHLPDGDLPSAIAARLAELGGRLTGWHPVINGAPAKACFSFETEEDCDRFVAGARGIPGVSFEVRA
jgi:hypothetical protein